MAEVIIGSAVKNVTHIACFDTLADARYSGLDLAMLLVINYDTLDESLLDLMLTQLDMQGYNGGILADTVAKKRALLKSAISIKKALGTPSAIKQVALALGIQGEVFIEEGISFLLDGSVLLDGSRTLGGGDWAVFKVRFNGALNPGLNSAKLAIFANMINQIKPARSKLAGVYLY